MEFFAKPRLRGHQRGLAGDVLRDVRLDLLPQPVPAERARQHAAAGRRQAAGLDRRDDARRARSPGSSPSATAAGCSWSPGWRCRRSRSAGWPPIASVDHELREHDRPVRPRPAPAWRWCSRRRPTRCSPRCAPTRPARPRARPTRSASSAACSASRAGHRVHQPRRLRLAAGVRQRPRAGDVGRRRGARASARLIAAGAAVQHPGRAAAHARGGGRAERQPVRAPGAAPSAPPERAVGSD